MPLAHKGLVLTKPDAFESGSGIGVRGTIDGKRLVLGNSALMEQEGVAIDALRSDGERLRSEGASVMHLAVDGQLAGILAVTDPIKATTLEAIRTLHASGLRIVMATGDGLTTAKAVGARLGHRRSAWRSQASRQASAGGKTPEGRPHCCHGR
jgi:Cu+-exporting ATPase